MARDPRLALLTQVDRTKATVQKTAAQHAAAQLAHRQALAAALAGGVSKAELARRTQTSESRIRQSLARGQAGF